LADCGLLHRQTCPCEKGSERWDTVRPDSRPLNNHKVFDLGGKQLTVYEVPGHSPGCIVLLDVADGSLFAGDALGSNRPYIVDSLWMQMPGMASMDRYLSSLQVFRSQCAR
jgi:glyoxylase-like metal-dependent hydrolase (beta-lactamase superfamily II)